tara:strand:+ start:366 stop:1073 length:708 start_codon:yes stop_codon:yes gene_type:complete
MQLTITQLKEKIEAIEAQDRKYWNIQEQAKKALFAEFVTENLELKNVEAFGYACLGTSTMVKPNYNLYFNSDFRYENTTVEVSAYSWRIEQGKGGYDAYLDTIIDGANIARFIEDNLEEIKAMLSTCLADVEPADWHYRKYLKAEWDAIKEVEKEAEDFQKMAYLKEGIELDSAVRVELKQDWNPRVKEIKVVKETPKTFTVDFVCGMGYSETESRVNKHNVLNAVFGWDYEEVA